MVNPVTTCRKDNDICHQPATGRLVTVGRIADKLMLAVVCALLLVRNFGSMTPLLIAVILTAICYAGLDEWLILVKPQQAWVPTLVVSTIAIWSPTFIFALPAVAYDAARLIIDDSHTSARIRTMQRVSRIAWVVPLATELLFQSPDRYLDCAIVIVLSCIAHLWGRSAHKREELTDRLRATQDELRSDTRMLRARLTDTQEAHSEATRIATLNERTRIARDIHDNVGHLLTRAIMQSEADRVVAEARQDTVAAQQFADVNATISEAMTMVRRSVHDLDDAGVDFRTWMADAAQSTARLHVTLNNSIVSAPAPVARCFAAVIRESLANTARHSAADSVTVSLQDFPAFWQLVVQDNGRIVNVRKTSPLPATSEHDARGMGLADIEARVQALDGTCSTGMTDVGWRVFVSLPKPQQLDKQGEQA